MYKYSYCTVALLAPNDWVHAKVSFSSDAKCCCSPFVVVVVGAIRLSAISHTSVSFERTNDHGNQNRRGTARRTKAKAPKCSKSNPQDSVIDFYAQDKGSPLVFKECFDWLFKEQGACSIKSRCDGKAFEAISPVNMLFWKRNENNTSG